MSEVERVTQMRHVLRCLGLDGAAATGRRSQQGYGSRALPRAMAPGMAAAAVPPSPHLLLLGDMNALRRSDYSGAEWDAHLAHNAANGWQPPSDSEVYDLTPNPNPNPNRNPDPNPDSDADPDPDSKAPEHSLGLLLGAGFHDCVRSAIATESAGGPGPTPTPSPSPPLGRGPTTKRPPATSGIIPAPPSASPATPHPTMNAGAHPNAAPTRPQGVGWASAPWSAHVHAAGSPRYRIDYVFSRPPDAHTADADATSAGASSDKVRPAHVELAPSPSARPRPHVQPSPSPRPPRGHVASSVSARA